MIWHTQKIMTTEEMFARILEILERMEARQVSGFEKISEIKSEGSFGGTDFK